MYNPRITKITEKKDLLATPFFKKIYSTKDNSISPTIISEIEPTAKWDNSFNEKRLEMEFEHFRKQHQSVKKYHETTPNN